MRKMYTYDRDCAQLRQLFRKGCVLALRGEYGRLADGVADLVRARDYLLYPCPCCGTRFNHLLKRCGRRAILACPNCLLSYVAPPPPARDLDALYANPAQYEKTIGGAGMAVQQYGETMLRREWILNEVDFGAWETARGPGRKMLEIGCFDGSHLMLYRNRGWEVEGIEITGSIAAMAAARGIKVYGKRVEELRLPDANYDFITMNHTLEHVHNPGAVLREIQRILRPGGRMILQVPREAPCWDEGREHLIFLTPESLRRMLGLAGFRVLSLFEKTLKNRANDTEWVELTCYTEKQ